jgi:hypothetical protein
MSKNFVFDDMLKLQESFTMDGDKSVMRFDELRVSLESPSRMAVDFCWRGQALYRRIIDCDINAGQNVTITGLDAKVPITLARA